MPWPLTLTLTLTLSLTLTLIQARLRAMADALNTELSATAVEHGVQDWPPLNHSDVVAWSRCVAQTTQMSPDKLNQVYI